MSATDQSTRTGPRGPQRREVLLGGAAAVLLAACSNGGGASGPALPGTTPGYTDPATAAQAVGLLVGISGVIRETTAKHPALAGRLDRFEQVHQAHLAAVAAALPDGTPPSTPARPYRVPASSDRALDAAVARETELRDRLLALALRAESGPFARLLGTMTAALSQQLAVVGG